MAWFETWFDTPYYHILYKNRDFAEAENFIHRLTDFLEIPKNSEIIDLACGKGRHSIYLNQLGYKVLGLDLSAKSIAHNQKFENENLRFSVHDMREEISSAISPNKVKAVFNLFTSFGYFDQEEDDRKVFHSVANVLEDGGFFILDFLNSSYIEKNLVKKEHIQKEGITFHLEKRIENGNVIKDIFFETEGTNHHYFENVKLHTLAEITEYAKEAGFETSKVFGDYQLNDFQLETSPRCINVFQKIKKEDKL